MCENKRKFTKQMETIVVIYMEILQSLQKCIDKQVVRM